MNKLVGYIGFAVLTFALLILGYMVSYCWWMNAHPVYQSEQWKSLFYQRLAMFVPICLAWVWSLKSMIAKRHTT